MSASVPGVAWCAPMRVDSQASEGELRGVREASQWRCLCGEPLDQAARLLPGIWQGQPGAGKALIARCGEKVLHRDGQAGQVAGFALSPESRCLFRGGKKSSFIPELVCLQVFVAVALVFEAGAGEVHITETAGSEIIAQLTQRETAELIARRLAE